MSKITITASQMKASAEALKQLNDQFKAAVNRLLELQQNLSGMWEGEANDAFARAFQSDKIQMDNFYNAVEVYVQRLDAAAARYQQAEAQNTQTANERKY